jgi:hypothetical protein
MFLPCSMEGEGSGSFLEKKFLTNLCIQKKTESFYSDKRINKQEEVK